MKTALIFGIVLGTETFARYQPVTNLDGKNGRCVGLDG